ncbi:hypothetical protein [Alkalibacillus haloalkaliphilus]|uniref:Uncharacterized protein n=1 Tax=Alkalibacillus haloalkaliphilus TaxID=94136 RepID=A0A511W853_9BACI|nr:hypothetical protein [Alkalibacillus haloalkaliphilus]GEN45562.1 hypothetical protein AHA02nite_13380 [Alkalibacillus haloalkaliphilus]
MTSENVEINQTIKVVYGIVVTILLLLAASMILSDYGTSDTGLLLIIVFLFIRGVYKFYQSLLEKNKKSIIFEIVFVLVVSVMLINIFLL